ncbi:MAG: hypothetical protein V4527_18945 [Pseudomonadota bacterium]
MRNTWKLLGLSIFAVAVAMSAPPALARSSSGSSYTRGEFGSYYHYRFHSSYRATTFHAHAALLVR